MAYETTIEYGQIIIKSKYDARNNVKIESHEYPVNREKNYKVEYRVYSPNGYDSWNAPDKHYFSITQAIKHGRELIKEFDKEYEYMIKQSRNG